MKVKFRVCAQAFKARGLLIWILAFVALLLDTPDLFADVGDLLATFNFQSNDLLPDPNQPFVYASVASTDSIAVINTQSLTVTRNITLPGEPLGLSLSSDSQTLYVADETHKTIDVIDTHSFSLLRSLPLSTMPYDVAAGPNNRLYVLDQSPIVGFRIEQIDATTGSSTGASTFSPLNFGNLTTSPDRTTLYFGDQGSSPSTLTAYDVSTASITQTRSIEPGSNAKQVALSHNGTLIAQPNGAPYYVELYRSSDFTTLGSFNTGAYPDAIAFSPNDCTAYVAHSPYPTAVDIYDTTSFAEEGQFFLPDSAADMVTDSQGQELFVTFVGGPYGVKSTYIYAVPEPNSIELAVLSLCVLVTSKMKWITTSASIEPF